MMVSTINGGPRDRVGQRRPLVTLASPLLSVTAAYREEVLQPKVTSFDSLRRGPARRLAPSPRQSLPPSCGSAPSTLGMGT